MLEQTFVHLPIVGETTERRLWESGVMTWADALEATETPRGFSAGRWEYTQSALEGSLRALKYQAHSYFSTNLKRRDHWRAWPEFEARAAFLDIETTGLSSADIITVVGLYDGTRTSTFIAGENLDELPEALAQYGMLVTFNGASFDLPFLARCIPGLSFPQLHVDLMYPLRSLGLRGGLKAVEQRIGLKRAPDVAGLDGWDAVRLWREWEAGSEASLELLVRYNTADIENLEHLMKLAYRGMRESLKLPCDSPAEDAHGR